MHFLCDWEASLLIQILIVHLSGRCLSGFSPQLKFFLLLVIPLANFSWLLWGNLWLLQTPCTFLDNLLSSFTGPPPSFSSSSYYYDDDDYYLFFENLYNTFFKNLLLLLLQLFLFLLWNCIKLFLKIYRYYSYYYYYYHFVYSEY